MEKKKRFFDLPGVTLTNKPGTATHELAELKVAIEGRGVLVISVIRSRKAPQYADFLPANANWVGGEPCWSFRELKDMGFDGLAKLFRLTPNGQPHLDLIGLVDRDVRELKAVIPLSELGKVKLENTADYGLVCLGGKFQPHELLRLKVALAYQEDLVCLKTSAEEALLRQIHEIEEAEIAAEKAKREAARLERRKAILGRPQVTVFTQTFDQVTGVPVAGDEWQALTNGQTAILVETYDQELRKSGKPLEAFEVHKTAGGRATKQGVKTCLSWERPKPKTTGTSFKLFSLNGQLASIAVVSSADLNELRQTLNSGTKVAVPEGDKFQIYSLEKGKSRPLGLHASL